MNIFKSFDEFNPLYSAPTVLLGLGVDAVFSISLRSDHGRHQRGSQVGAK